jgi:hypothetical protein
VDQPSVAAEEDGTRPRQIDRGADPYHAVVARALEVLRQSRAFGTVEGQEDLHRSRFGADDRELPDGGLVDDPAHRVVLRAHHGQVAEGRQALRGHQGGDRAAPLAERLVGEDRHAGPDHREDEGDDARRTGWLGPGLLEGVRQGLPVFGGEEGSACAAPEGVVRPEVGGV